MVDQLVDYFRSLRPSPILAATCKTTAQRSCCRRLWFFLIALVTAFLLQRFWPLELLPPVGNPIKALLGGALAAFAIYTNFAGFFAFRQAGANINLYKPAMVVVRDGAFRYTSNSIYLGMVLLPAGLGLILANPWAFIAAALLWAVLHYGVVLREEAYLSAKFDAALSGAAG